MTVLHKTISDEEDFDDRDLNQMMPYLFPIIIELFIDDKYFRDHAFISTCMSVNITTSYYSMFVPDDDEFILLTSQ